ncbi:hypothetical protein BsWGS_26890 [Bradybaena similaris]
MDLKPFISQFPNSHGSLTHHYQTPPDYHAPCPTMMSPNEAHPAPMIGAHTSSQSSTHFKEYSSDQTATTPHTGPIFPNPMANRMRLHLKMPCSSSPLSTSASQSNDLPTSMFESGSLQMTTININPNCR